MARPKATHTRVGIMGNKGWLKRPTKVKQGRTKKTRYMETKIWDF